MSRHLRTILYYSQQETVGVDDTERVAAQQGGEKNPQERLEFMFPPAQLTLFIQKAILNTKLDKVPATLA